VKGIERVGHVGVLEVPRVAAATEHRSVVALGVSGQLGVLLSREIGVAGTLTVAADEFGGTVAQLPQLRHDGVLTKLLATEDGGRAVCLFVEMVEARVAVAGAVSGRRIHLLR
jgi:hypothetical protein